MKITDMLDDFQETSIPLSPASTPSVERTLDLTKKKLGHKTKKRRRFSLRLITAACLVVIFSLTAGAAYYFTHQNTISLMETGPHSGGAYPVALDDTSKDVIENAAKDVGSTVEDSGATVTLDSTMGFHSEYMSVFYLTFTVVPPVGTPEAENIEDWGFLLNDWRFSVPVSSGGGTTVAVKNPDGTYSGMVTFTYFCDMKDAVMELTLGGFGDVSKEAAKELYAGTRTIEIPGTWNFTVDLNLDEAKTLDFSPDAFDGSNILAKSVALSSFGGLLVTENQIVSDFEIPEALEPVIAAHGDIEWDAITAEQLNLLLAEGSVFDDQETEILSELLATDLFRRTLENITLVYPDGKEYAANTTVWNGYTPAGEFMYAFLFEAPQDLEQAESLKINDICIPLR